MGANLALADAEALGECLAAVVTGGQAVPAALGRFEEARRPPADAACLLSRRIGSVRQGGHGPIASAEALTLEMSGDASTAHRSRI